MPRDYQRLDRFLDEIGADIYPEPDTDFHSGISREMFERLMGLFALPEGARVLDVGCGSGVALDLFYGRRLDAIGVTLGEADLAAARTRGFVVEAMDQSFLDFPRQSFDLVWARHVLEHSVFPFYTLSEMSRVLKPGGVFYMEVPAPETSAHHERNKNHYSVLGRGAWLELLARSGFSVVDAVDINLTLVSGSDTYWVFFCRKEIHPRSRADA
ncbi:MAG: class I SAM-dependent methyltransferase [Betaproteobacteria bacterium]|nr:class I SAM-dependent methyltransferase [Betaproteobacteria bacterium]